MCIIMPKRKRSYSTKSRSSKKVKKFVKRRRIAPKLASRIKRVESLIRKTIESKHMDWTATPVNGEQIYAASPVSKLAFLRISSTGADENERVGDKVTLMSQRFMINLLKGDNDLNAAGTMVVKNDQQIRVLIVENLCYDPATDLAVTDVLERGSWATNQQLLFTSPYKLGARPTKRYRVLYDKVFHLHDMRPFVKIDFLKRYGTKNNPGKVLSYESDTSVFPSNHRLNCFVLSDYVTGTHPPLVTIDVRNKYRDS